MSDLKMGDMFNLPLKKNGFMLESDPYSVLGSMGEVVDSIECCTSQEAEYVAYAINSHDQLTSDLAAAQREIAELREVMKSLTVMACASATELEYMIDMKKAQLESEITSTGLDDHDYFDHQTVHETMVECEKAKQLLGKGKI